MNFLNRLERKFGRYAIRNLSAVIIGLYVAGYVLSLTSPSFLQYLTLEPYYILKGQIWRVLTWIIIPPGSLSIFTVIMLFFYYSIGQTLERTWGAFRFNFYILMGIVFTVIGAFLLYGFCYARYGYPMSFGSLFSTYYINMSIFLAFAVSYPDMQVLLYFFIPVKMKWMGILYGVLILYTALQGTWVDRVAILASLLNFIIYFLMTAKSSGQAAYRRAQWRQQTSRRPGTNWFQTGRGEGSKPRTGGSKGTGSTGGAAPMHRCAICGRTEQDGANLVFRYCSKCNGAYEYCQDHLFNHEHRI